MLKLTQNTHLMQPAEDLTCHLETADLSAFQASLEELEGILALNKDSEVIKRCLFKMSRELKKLLREWEQADPGICPEDSNDFKISLKELIEILDRFNTEGALNSHDLANKVNLLGQETVFEIPDKMREDSKFLCPLLFRLVRLPIPFNMDLFPELTELPQGTQVLVVEDDLNVIDLVKNQVGQNGEVTSATNPDELPQSGNFDLILLDWYWGLEIGGNYIELLKQRFPSAVIIGHSSSSNRQKYFGEIPACSKGGWFELYMKASGKA